MLRIGHGYDVHRFKEGRKLFLGGVFIEGETGLDGHSDADAVLHAVCDSILGALSKGDIGKLFPPDDQRFKDIDSRILLRKTFSIMKKEKYNVSNIDITIIAQKPRLSSYTEKMEETIAKDLETEKERINVKATTEEHLGFTGRCEGIAVHCVCLLEEKK